MEEEEKIGELCLSPAESCYPHRHLDNGRIELKEREGGKGEDIGDQLRPPRHIEDVSIIHIACILGHDALLYIFPWGIGDREDGWQGKWGFSQ